MPLQKVEGEKLSGAVVRQRELLILSGILRPSVRELSERLGVSRPIACAKRSQSFRTVAFSPALISLFSRHDTAVRDYLTLRRDMEGLVAMRRDTRQRHRSCPHPDDL